MDAKNTDNTAGASGAICPGGKGWQPGEAQYGYELAHDLFIDVVDDGIRLEAGVTWPTDTVTGKRSSGTFSVLVEFTPYQRQDYEGLRHTYLVEHGYIVAQVHPRGSGKSTGVLEQFTSRDGLDGEKVVEWAAKLDGSNGKVGFFGSSYPGALALATAARVGKGSALKAVLAASIGTGAQYRQAWTNNGLPIILTPGSMHTFEMALKPIQYGLRPGHRLRLVLSAQGLGPTTEGRMPAEGGMGFLIADPAELTAPQEATVHGGVYTIGSAALGIPSCPSRALPTAKSAHTGGERHPHAAMSAPKCALDAFRRIFPGQTRAGPHRTRTLARPSSWPPSRGLRLECAWGGRSRARGRGGRRDEGWGASDGSCPDEEGAPGGGAGRRGGAPGVLRRRGGARRLRRRRGRARRRPGQLAGPGSRASPTRPGSGS